MEEYITALENLNKALESHLKTQEQVNKILAVKLRQLEVSVKTGSWYPIDKAEQDFEKAVKL